MRLNFHHILSRVGARCMHGNKQYLINTLTIFWIDNNPKYKTVAG